jgi:POT family proton-dependent oligopeptide transporter
LATATSSLEIRSTGLRNHPRALTFLFLTQMWERFSFYGMRSLLILYLISGPLQPERAPHVIGYESLKGVLESVFGPLSAQATASQIYGLYVALVYLMPLPGGILADRWLGWRKSTLLGGALIACGHLLMTSEPALLLALLLITLGSGCFTPNIVAQVGALYESADPRRDSAFSLFYLGVNLGAFISPLVCGTVGEIFGWHYGFALAGGGMLIGLATFIAGRKHLPADPGGRTARPSPGTRAASGGGSLWIVLTVLVLLSTLFWASYEQVGNVLNLWLLNSTDRSLFGHELHVTWFQSVNPLLILTLTPVLIAFWARLGARGREPSTLAKMASGCLLLAAAYLVLALAVLTSGGERVSWMWTLIALFCVTLGELYLAPTSWSLFSRLAPPHLASVSMGIWYLSLFAGGYLAGLLGTFWDRLSHLQFWLLIATVTGTGGVGLLLVKNMIERRVAAYEQEPR